MMAKLGLDIIVKFTRWYWILRIILFLRAFSMLKFIKGKPIATINGDKAYFNYYED